VRLVERSKEVANGWSEGALEGPVLRRHHVYVDSARAQGRGHLEGREACPEQHRASRCQQPRDDRARVVESSQIVNVR
jgi:hypothetical protein